MNNLESKPFHEWDVDVTITAVVRPDILRKTLDSFFDNLLQYVRCRAIVNVDPVGYEGVRPFEIIQIVEEYFPMCDSRESFGGHFGYAMCYTWNMVTADWVFHLEDDWELLRPVDITQMITILKSESDLASLRLPQFKSDSDGMKNWNLWFPWNGRYFECPDELRVTQGPCGHPSLLKGEYVKACAPLIDPNLNPEKQFHGGNDALTAEVGKWRFGVFGQPNEDNYIRDLGRAWMVEHGFRKAGSKAYFTNWEKN